jgi:hypothetical protein
MLSDVSGVPADIPGSYMKMSLSRGSALVLAGGALALTGAILPAQAATSTGWRVNATVSVRGNATIFTGIDAVSARDAWASGLSAPTKGDAVPQALIRHWNGRSWAAVTLPAKLARAWAKAEGFEGQIGATSPSDVWIVGAFDGAYLRLNGKHWSAGKLPGNNESAGILVDITTVRVFSSSDVWAFGARTNIGGTTETTTPYSAHFNGKAWKISTMPAGLAGVVTAASGSSRSIWAVAGTESGPITGPFGGAAKAEVLHWTSAAGWTEPAQPVLPAGAELGSVLTESNGTVLAGGSEKNSHKGTTPLAATWNGKTWAVRVLPDSSSAKWTLTSLAADGRGAWAIAYASNRESSQLWRLSGSSWSNVKPAFGKHAFALVQLAAVPGTSSDWAAGALKEGNGALAMIAVAGPTPR